MPRLRRPLALAVAVAASAQTAAAQATVITFSSNACTGTGINFYDGFLDVQGFRFAAATTRGLDFGTPCSGSALYAGAPTLYNNYVGGITTLTSLSGTPFAIQSIDLAPFFLDGASENVTLTGTLVGGATVTQTFAIPKAATSRTLATYTFQPTFTNLESVRFSAQTDPDYEFTNVRLSQSTAPEPGTWALLGTGLLGVGGVARQRRRA